MKLKRLIQLLLIGVMLTTNITSVMASEEENNTGTTYQIFLPMMLVSVGSESEELTDDTYRSARQMAANEKSLEYQIEQGDKQYPIQADRDILIVSPDLFQLLRAWQGDSPENRLLEEFLIERTPEAIGKWVVEAEQRNRTNLVNYINKTYPNLKPDSRDSTSLAQALILEYPEYLFSWQVTQLQDEDRLRPFVERNMPELYAAWRKEIYVPATEMCLLDYVSKVSSEVIEEATRYYEIRTGSKVCPPEWPPPPPPPKECSCKHIFTFDADPVGFQSNTDPTVEDDDDKKKDQWWTEQWKAAHYGELYAHIKKKPMTTFDIADLHNTNSATIAYELSCEDTNHRDCTTCFAKLEQYAHYGSKIQTHIEGKGSLFRPKELKVAAGDSAKMITTLENGQVVGFEKAGAVTMHSKKTFDGTKVVNIIKSIINIAFEVAEITNDNEGDSNDPDWQKTLTLGADTVKNFFGLVKYEGMEGTKSHEVKVTFNSNAFATDPTHTIESNQGYALRIESSGSITFEAKGKFAKTNNSYYGSGFAAAMGIHNIACIDEVNRIPNPAGAWSYANTYRSPYANTSTFQSNVANFIQQAVNSSIAPDTSADQGWWEAP